MILSIESSCDDSSIAINRIVDYKLIFHRKISQDKDHSKYGGVVPELASRLHCVSLPYILRDLKTNIDINSIKAVAVTNEPGLSVSLIEGVMMAKALSISLNIPLIKVNHLKGHIYSLFLETHIKLPLSILLLSGGHTLLLEMYDIDNIKIIANTLDDSFGEAFDKVSTMLSLGYPGGPIVETYASNAIDKNLLFPLPLKDKKDISFSFSGLKNAVRLYIESIKNNKKDILDSTKSEVCYAFQDIAIKHIAQKSELYLKQSPIKIFGIVGGASANLALRKTLVKLAKTYDKQILFAPLEFCSDNAAMIGRCAIDMYNNNRFIDFDKLDISPHTTCF